MAACTFDLRNMLLYKPLVLLLLAHTAAAGTAQFPYQCTSATPMSVCGTSGPQTYTPPAYANAYAFTATRTAGKASVSITLSGTYTGTAGQSETLHEQSIDLTDGEASKTVTLRFCDLLAAVKQRYSLITADVAALKVFSYVVTANGNQDTNVTITVDSQLEFKTAEFSAFHRHDGQLYNATGSLSALELSHHTSALYIAVPLMCCPSTKFSFKGSVDSPAVSCILASTGDYCAAGSSTAYSVDAQQKFDFELLVASTSTRSMGVTLNFGAAQCGQAAAITVTADFSAVGVPAVVPPDDGSRGLSRAVIAVIAVFSALVVACVIGYVVYRRSRSTADEERPSRTDYMPSSYDDNEDSSYRPM